VAETTVKRLLCCGLRHTGKTMGQVYLEDMSNVFPRFIYHMFYVLYPFVTCLLTLPHRCLLMILNTMNCSSKVGGCV
jgi:hypothetical protein